MILAILLVYFIMLLLVSRFVGSDSNDAFFRGERKSPWPLVALGMVGASISGLTFVGVPGWVMGIDMTYMQMCFGFIVGYLIVAFVLLPIYYRYNLTSIYSFLERRFGSISYRTGAIMFIVSKLLGSAAKFYVVVAILQGLLIGDDGFGGYVFTAVVVLLAIWLYTHRGGIRTLVWTDVLQTLCLVGALVLILLKVCSLLEMNVVDAMIAVWNDPHSRMFELEDFSSKQFFWKQFLSGVFIVIVMTGLDQDMMQKNLTCKDLRSAQKDMCSYGLLFAPVNFLFLALGVLLLMLYSKCGLPLPAKGDELLSGVVCSGFLGNGALALFAIGIVASALSSADSSVTALTTSFCVDVKGMPENVGYRKKVHVAMMVLFLFFTLAFKFLGSGSVMDLIYTLVSYTYGPLLGLFSFAIFTKRKPREGWVPYIAVVSPLVCLLIDSVTNSLVGYKFGYEMLMFNGMLTLSMLYASSFFQAESSGS